MNQTFVALAILCASMGINSQYEVWGLADWEPATNFEPVVLDQGEPAPEKPAACVTAVIDPTGPYLTDRIYSRSLTGDQVRLDIVGSFLWVSFDQPDNQNSLDADTRSIFVDDGTTEVEVCR